MIQSFQDLEVCQESLDLVEEVEELVRSYPKHERYRLVDQSRRASRAIPAQIAEAWPKRKTLKHFRKHLRDAVGECNETMSHLEMARRFKYIHNPKAKELIERYDQLAGRIHKLKENWQNY